MPDEIFSQLQDLKAQQGNAGVISRLIQVFRDQKQYHQLFDASLMQHKLEMGLPVNHPTSFDDVPQEKRAEFEKHYIAAARQVGELLLADGQLAQAWMYLRTIREPEKMKQALEALDPRGASEELIEIALYQGVAPLRGVQMLLHSHGTCSTITALDQQFHQLNAAVRAQCAAELVKRLYEDLCYTLQSEIERKQGLTPPGQSLRELIAGRDWLFDDGNYHIDVSHLHAVIRFARSLDLNSPELPLAIQLAEYGAKLAPQYQYAGEAPFEEFYPAHREFLRVLANQNREAGLDYFRKKLSDDTGDLDSAATAYILLDLYLRLDRKDDALGIAEKYLVNVPEQMGFSFVDFCEQIGRYDVLQRVARERGDLLAYATALTAT